MSSSSNLHQTDKNATRRHWVEEHFKSRHNWNTAQSGKKYTNRQIRSKLGQEYDMQYCGKKPKSTNSFVRNQDWNDMY